MAERAGSRWRARQGEIIVMRGRRRRCETALNGCGPVAQLVSAGLNECCAGQTCSMRSG
jgi:hypothetical protein